MTRKNRKAGLLIVASLLAGAGIGGYTGFGLSKNLIRRLTHEKELPWEEDKKIGKALRQKI